MSKLIAAAPSAHSVNSNSNSNYKTQAAHGQRFRVGRLNLPAKQAISLPSGIRHELMFFPATSTPAWGSYFTVDLKSPGVLLHNLTLQFNLGQVVGTSIVGAFIPAYFWLNRVEIVQGGNVIKTIQGNQQFLVNNLFELDADSLPSIMNAAGRYDSSGQRLTLSSTSTTNTFYVNLKTFIDTISVPMLTEQHNIQLRIYLEPLNNVYAVTSGTLTSVAINSVNAIAKITKLDTDTTAQRLLQMSDTPAHNIFHDNVYFSYCIACGCHNVDHGVGGHYRQRCGAAFHGAGSEHGH